MPPPAPNPAGTAVDARSADGVPALVGREPVVARLAAALSAAAEGESRLLFLVGEAGIGKTRLVRELARLAGEAGYPLLIGRGEREGAPAYWPWAEVLRGLVESRTSAALAARAGPLIRLGPEPLPRPGDGPEQHPFDASARFELGVSLARALRTASREGPIVVALEDLHATDPDTVRLTRLVAHELQDAPVALVATCRDRDTDSDEALREPLAELAAAAEVVSLAGLDLSAVSRFIEALAGFAPADTLCAAVHAHTGGNPLFVTEVVRLLAAEDQLGGPDEPTPEGLPLPETVRHTLRRRIARLPGEARTVLETAAVIGTAFDGALLSDCVGLAPGDLAKALAAAEVDGLVAPSGAPGTYQFGHDLARAAIYQDLPGTERMSRHLRVGEALRRQCGERLEGRHAAIAHHLLQALPLGDPVEAAGFAHAAGDEALARLSLAEARRGYSAALAALGNAPEPPDERERFELQLKLGRVLWDLGHIAAARECHLDAAAAARDLGDAEALGRAALAYAGRTEVSLRGPDKVFALAQEALAALPPGESALRARLLALCATAHYIDGAGPDESERLACEALVMAERTRDDAALMAALVSREQTLMRPGGFAERTAMSARMLDCARSLGLPSALGVARMWRVVDLLEAVEIAEADRELGALEAYADESRIPFFQWMARSFRATRAFMVGPLDIAERLAHEALALGQQAGSPNAVAGFGTQLFHLREAQGRLDEMTGLMRSISEQSARMPVFRIALPLIHARCGRLAEARVAFEEVVARDLEDFPRDMHWLPLVSSTSVVCWYLRDGRRARMLHEHLTPFEGSVIVSGIGHYWTGPVTKWLADMESVLGEWDAAEAHYDDAVAVIRRAGSRPVLADTLLRRAVTLEWRGRSRDAARIEELRSEARALRLMLRGPRESASEADGDGASLCREGAIWQLRYEDHEVRLPDSKGLRYLAELLARPGSDLHVMDLAERARGGDPHPSGRQERARKGASTGLEAIDVHARSAYRERLASLREELDDAERRADLGQRERIQQEIGFLERELSASVGLGARIRRTGDDGERARKAVSNRLRATLRRIDDVHPDCGRHLRAALRTGAVCSYRPERTTGWRVEP